MSLFRASASKQGIGSVIRRVELVDHLFVRPGLEEWLAAAGFSRVEALDISSVLIRFRSLRHPFVSYLSSVWIRDEENQAAIAAWAGSELLHSHEGSALSWIWRVHREGRARGVRRDRVDSLLTAVSYQHVRRSVAPKALVEQHDALCRAEAALTEVQAGEFAHAAPALADVLAEVRLTREQLSDRLWAMSALSEEGVRVAGREAIPLWASITSTLDRRIKVTLAEAYAAHAVSDLASVAPGLEGDRALLAMLATKPLALP